MIWIDLNHWFKSLDLNQLNPGFGLHVFVFELPACKGQADKQKSYVAA